MAPKHPPGSTLTLGNMRELVVQNLIASCLNDACRHQALIDVPSYPAETEVPSFGKRTKCSKCAAGAWTCGQTGKKNRCSGAQTLGLRRNQAGEARGCVSR